MSASAGAAEELHYGNRYRVKNLLGSGSFGQVYLGEHVTTHEEVALKLESSISPHPQLQNECKIYKLFAGEIGFPSIKWSGTVGDYNAMAIDLLDCSLENLFNMCQRHFSLKTVLMIADQLLARLEFIHAKGFIHRDIKPDNFMTGFGKNEHLIYMIDFGLSKRFINPKTYKHISYSDGKDLTGTARYASINTHLGIDQSRRDDLEGIAYMLIYFMKGSLPWQGIKAHTQKQKHKLVGERKLGTPLVSLCSGLPPEFGQFLAAVRELGFQAAPKYRDYRRLFRSLFIREGYVYDNDFDWVKIREAQQNALLAGVWSEQQSIPADGEGSPRSVSVQQRKPTSHMSFKMPRSPVSPRTKMAALCH